MQLKRLRGLRLVGVSLVAAVAAAAIFAVVAMAAGDKKAASQRSTVTAACLTTMRCSANKADASWPNGQNGAVTGGRYSPLKQVNQSNVKRLKAAWTFKTNVLGSEDYPTVIGNNAYVTTSYGNVYKLNASTGEKLWSWNAFKQQNLGLAAFAGVHGFPNRGVTVANGRVFAVTPNAVMVALNDATGRVIWSKPQADPHYYSLSSPPAYSNGVLYYGSGGSEAGARGFVEARSAKDGHLIWRTYTVPAYGHDFMYQHHGGGAVWMAPTLDPAHGVMYVGVGNPSPDEYGAARPGPNKWTDSVLELNMKTGKIIWGYQQTPHDLWDYDAVSPPLLFPTTSGMAVGEANKGGYWYELSAKNGTPLIKPQSFVIQNQSLVVPGGPGKWEWPGGLHGGGSEYSPHAYDPATHLVFVDGLNSPDFVQLPKKQPVYKVGADVGADVANLGKTGKISGTLYAFDVNEGPPLWKRTFPVGMIGGETVTAGHLLFTQISGKGIALALDPKTGRTLWHANLGGRIDDAPSVYSVNGKEYVVWAVGGSSIAASGWGGKPASNAKFVAFALR